MVTPKKGTTMETIGINPKTHVQVAVRLPQATMKNLRCGVVNFLLGNAGLVSGL